MSYLYDETLNYIDRIGYHVSDIDYCSVIVDGHSKEVQFSFSTFRENSNFEYNDMYGDVEVNLSLRIIFKDGSWLSRWEEDGCEGWIHIIPSKKDEDKFFCGYINLHNVW